MVHDPFLLGNDQPFFQGRSRRLQVHIKGGIHQPIILGFFNSVDVGRGAKIDKNVKCFPIATKSSGSSEGRAKSTRSLAELPATRCSPGTAAAPGWPRPRSLAPARGDSAAYESKRCAWMLVPRVSTPRKRGHTVDGRNPVT